LQAQGQLDSALTAARSAGYYASLKADKAAARKLVCQLQQQQQQQHEQYPKAAPVVAEADSVAIIHAEQRQQTKTRLQEPAIKSRSTTLDQLQVLNKQSQSTSNAGSTPKYGRNLMSSLLLPEFAAAVQQPVSVASTGGSSMLCHSSQVSDAKPTACPDSTKEVTQWPRDMQLVDNAGGRLVQLTQGCDMREVSCQKRNQRAPAMTSQQIQTHEISQFDHQLGSRSSNNQDHHYATAIGSLMHQQMQCTNDSSDALQALLEALD